MKSLIKKIVVVAGISAGLTSCAALYNTNQNSYSNAKYNNGYYYAPNSYYGNGGYYGNDGYYYRKNMNYQYDDNIPYYYGENQRKIYIRKQNTYQRPTNGFQDTRNTRVRNNADGHYTPNNPDENRGFRNAPDPSNTQRNETNSERTRTMDTRTQNENGGFRNAGKTQTTQTRSGSEDNRDGRR